MRSDRPLRQRVIHATGWTLVGYLGSQAIRLGGNLILTRLLAPGVFGLMALVYVLMTGLAMFSDLGVTQAIIRSPGGEEPRFLNTAWALQIVRGSVIWVLALGVAALAAGLGEHGVFKAGSVYSDPRLATLVAAFSFTALIQSLASTKLAGARRKLQIRELTIIDIVSPLTALVVMIPIAWLTHSVWALVIGGIVAAGLRAALSHLLLAGPSNRLEWNRDVLREIASLGKWIFFSSLIGFLAMNGDRLILGGLVDPFHLGLYSIAFLIVNSAQMVMLQLITSVALPSLSEVARQTPSRLAEVYYRIRTWFDLAAFGSAGFLCIAGPLIARTLYDNRYKDAGSIISILALSLMFVPFALTENCFYILGRPDINTASSLLRMTWLYILVPVGFLFAGFEGALYAIALTSASALPLTYYVAYRLKLLRPIREMIGLPAFAFGSLLGLGANTFF